MLESNFQETKEILRSAIKDHIDLKITTGLNIAGTVLIDLAVSQGFDGDVVFVDTNYHFSETLSFFAYLKSRYQSANFITLKPKAPFEDGYLIDPVACCSQNKVEPLEDFLAATMPSAILNGRTRESASTRNTLGALEDGNPIRLNPLYRWERKDLESYAKSYDLRLHPLYSQGYLSMGCWPCTAAVKAGEDIRAGRFVGQGRTECGIWTKTKPPAQEA
ncbi:MULTISPECIES: phosphoadenylyl-sulfate reductase [Acidithrix]|uniref:Adenosine 5'-phosphosulfate reductase n=1 Tax=Acidithrix ferrooxidans TaxID=1280514 RepID=A0A0D8HH67_9ACTN|nr:MULTISPECIES: phosphoadenylyl-sulfate reductase [Acidithrix]KJF17199.1 phosphoadenosine phosphosulfate reductase [Acidithrix ferrooxidans]CAG4913845.1 unnamed protein product [Acidithrix sp. C25]